jgi:L-lactate dehydrogenase
VNTKASTEYGITRKINHIIITTGATQRPGESRLNLVERNVNIMKSVITKVFADSPNTTSIET